MIISHRLKYVFVHVPKTAGTSIETLMKDNDEFQVDVTGHWKGIEEVDFQEDPRISRELRNHADAKEIRKYFEREGFNWDDYFKFGFIRNPWDLNVSQYFYWMQTMVNEATTDENRVLIEKYKDKPPKDFIKEKATYDFVDHFLCNEHDHKRDLIVDFVGKFENLEEDFNAALQQISPHFGTYSLGKMNASERDKDYRKYYDEETRLCVKKAFYKTRRIGKYEF